EPRRAPGRTYVATMTGRTDSNILHVDLDAFYASVEQLADPTLRGRPVIVGGLGPRGVVAAASYEARRFGVYSATPMARARRACPEGVFLEPRFDLYHEASGEVMRVFHSFTPLVEPIALDEAFLDVAGARRIHGDGPQIAETIRSRVRAETGLTASVGVATTKLLAKLASDLAKPDGLLVVKPGTELAFLHPLEVRRLWGVGPATAKRLAALGVQTVGELSALPEAKLVATLGNAAGHHLHALAWNRDDREVQPDHAVKSVGHEETFPADVHDRAVLRQEVLRLADRVASRLRKASRTGRTVQLKVRYADFRTITRARTLATATDLAADIAETARELLDALPIDDGVRLLGVSVQQLAAGRAPAQDEQGNLFERPAEGWAETRERQAAVEHSLDLVRERFGPGAIGSGVTNSLHREGSGPPTR
ncbi:MAG: DNA polymerase IV, partial [Acidimicrobiia bacterium]